MGMVRSKSDAAGLTFLALLVFASAVLALLGYELAVLMFGFLAGFSSGWVVSYLLTGPRRYRGWVAAGLGIAVLLPFVVSAFVLARGAEWLILNFGYDSFGGALWFGVALGVIQVVLFRLSGHGPRVKP